MTARSLIPRLTDIIEASELIRSEMAGVTLDPPVIWTLVQESLPPLESVCRDELAVAIVRETG